MTILRLAAGQAAAWNAEDAFYKGTTKRHVMRRIRFVTADVASTTRSRPGD